MKLISSWVRLNRTLGIAITLTAIFCALFGLETFVSAKSAAKSKPQIVAQKIGPLVVQPKIISQSVFKIVSLTDHHVSAIDAASQIEDDRGGIAVSISKAFLNGDGGVGIYNRLDFSNSNAISTLDGIVMDLDSQNVAIRSPTARAIRCRRMGLVLRLSTIFSGN